MCIRACARARARECVRTCGGGWVCVCMPVCLFVCKMSSVHSQEFVLLCLGPNNGGIVP